ncbi:hypothetical protein ACFPT5_11735 [Ornithinimicrobium kibberense]
MATMWATSTTAQVMWWSRRSPSNSQAQPPRRSWSKGRPWTRRSAALRSSMPSVPPRAVARVRSRRKRSTSTSRPSTW